jgi:hypothetical protein
LKDFRIIALVVGVPGTGWWCVWAQIGDAAILNRFEHAHYLIYCGNAGFYATENWDIGSTSLLELGKKRWSQSV